MFWEIGLFSDKIWAWDLWVFHRIDGFLTKTGNESIHFFVKNQKKRASYWLFSPIIELTFGRISVFSVFWPIMWMMKDGFSWKISKNKNVIRAPYFWENRHFLTKYVHESYLFFRDWTSFGQNMGERAVIFSWFSWKKGILWTFLAHNRVSYSKISVFWPIMWMIKGGSSWKFWKKTSLEHRIFERLDVFWQNMGMKATCFLEIGLFLTKYGQVSEHWFCRET